MAVSLLAAVDSFVAGGCRGRARAEADLSMTKKRNKGKARKRRGAANNAASSSPSNGGVDAGQELGGAEQVVGNLSLGCDHGTPARLNKVRAPVRLFMAK